jgi:superfamily II DNA/RNA helicase
MQIDAAMSPFCLALGLQHMCVYGGVPKAPQARAIKAGVEVLTATPGRVLDLVASKACSLADVSYLVLDEADRMLSMGFEPQIQETVKEVCETPSLCCQGGFGLSSSIW